jgi:hypothetical protein
MAKKTTKTSGANDDSQDAVVVPNVSDKISIAPIVDEMRKSYLDDECDH